MSLELPFAGPYNTGTYPVAEPYDGDDQAPANWRLKFAAERPASAGIVLRAVCAGTLTAVPPEELPPSWLGLTSIPDGVYPNAENPQPVRLYLKPNLPGSLPFSASLTGSDWRFQLANEGLGYDIRWFVYENLDPTRLGAAITAALAADPNLGKLTLNGRALTAEERLEAFLEGQATVDVAAGTELGRASTANATVAGHARAQFGVRTGNGYVDPVAVYVVLQSLLSPAAQDDFGAFASLFVGDWPFLPTTLAGALPAVIAQLYPWPVLSWAFVRVPGFADSWRTVGDAQKALYWDQLRVRSGHHSGPPAFAFHTEDMGNTFQVEAVAEYFMAWPLPSGPGPATSPPATVPGTPQVDLLEGDWNIVLLDPFDHMRLGDPLLPKPDYELLPYNPPQPIVPCDPANTPTPLQADRYRGVLFLVHRGKVVAWHRWSTISSHRWEDTLHQWDPNGSNTCNWASSIQGNRKYYFYSRTSATKAINYAFQLYDAANLIDRNWVPGRYYFRTGVPVDDAHQHGDPPEDEPGKEYVIIHYGYARDHDMATDYNNQLFDYSGSAGCLVSPEFYKLRNRMIPLHLTYTGEDEDLSVLKNCDKQRSEQIFNGQITFYKRKYDGQASWDHKIEGTAYVIRPDEAEVR